MIIIQIFGWILFVVFPVIFFIILKTGKLRSSDKIEKVKSIACFVLMGIFALGVISSLLSLLMQLFWFRLPTFLWQFLSLWGLRPDIVYTKFSLFGWFHPFNDNLFNLLFSGGMIFVYVAMSGLLRKGGNYFLMNENQVVSKVDSPNNLDNSNKIESKYYGGVLPIFLFCIWAPFLLVFSLGLATPFIICTVIRWICNNSNIDGKKYGFKGTAMGLFGRWILWYILTIITIGIYGFWSTRNQIRWVVENIEMID
ncbi:MAG: YjgN family protein [Treponema sp.]|nr:YjgN family protein [Treponema sp.]